MVLCYRDTTLQKIFNSIRTLKWRVETTSLVEILAALQIFD